MTGYNLRIDTFAKAPDACRVLCLWLARDHISRLNVGLTDVYVTDQVHCAIDNPSMYLVEPDISVAEALHLIELENRWEEETAKIRSVSQTHQQPPSKKRKAFKRAQSPQGVNRIQSSDQSPMASGSGLPEELRANTRQEKATRQAERERQFLAAHDNTEALEAFLKQLEDQGAGKMGEEGRLDLAEWENYAHIHGEVIEFWPKGAGLISC